MPDLNYEYLLDIKWNGGVIGIEKRHLGPVDLEAAQSQRDNMLRIFSGDIESIGIYEREIGPWVLVEEDE